MFLLIHRDVNFSDAKQIGGTSKKDVPHKVSQGELCLTAERPEPGRHNWLGREVEIEFMHIQPDEELASEGLGDNKKGPVRG